MDRKHAMLYPALDGNGSSTVSNDQRLSASAAIGLPTELPPSYDMAVGGSSNATAAPAGAYAEVIVEDPGQGLSTPTTGSSATTNASDTRRIASSSLGPNPCAATCPMCGQCRTTRMRYTSNTRTHLCALFLCLVGWCCCACLVPYCMKSCRNGNHYCSKCNTFLGTYDPHRLT